jgi:hypothetical protein
MIACLPSSPVAVVPSTINFSAKPAIVSNNNPMIAQ